MKKRNQNFLDNGDIQILVSSLGLASGRSLYHFVLDNKFKIIQSDQININERIRDMIYVSDLNKIFLFLEDTSSIAIIEPK